MKYPPMHLRLLPLLALAAVPLAGDRDPLKPDQTVKIPVGNGLVRPIANLETCQTAGYSQAYAEAVAQGVRFCRNNYTCTDGSAVSYTPLRGLDACRCEAASDGGGGWQAVCELEYNGLCGCQSPNNNPDPSTLDVNLTPEESQMLVMLYRRLSSQLTARLKAAPATARAQMLATLAESLNAFRKASAFQTALSSRAGGSTLTISMAAPLAARVPGPIATVTISADGTARIDAKTKVPGGVARGLSTALATAIPLDSQK
jgi:hypothetical protein